MSDLPRLRDWNEVHIDEHIPVLTGHHTNSLFYNCTIDHMQDVVLDNCCMSKSKILADDLADLRNITLTLDCHTFSDVELSSSAFDLVLMLLIKSKGNVEKRRALIKVIGEDRLQDLLAQTRR